MINNRNHKKGFALFISLVIVGIVLAIGLSILEVTLKQFSISSTNRDSEIAFQASYAGYECLEFSYYHIGVDVFSDDGRSDAVDIDCLGENEVSSFARDSVGGDVEIHSYEITWGHPDGVGAGEICSVGHLFSVPPGKSYDPDDNLGTNDAYETLNCPATNNVDCLRIVARGYNRGCAERLNSIRTIEREIVR